MCSNQDLAAIGAALAYLTKCKAAGADAHAAALADVVARNGAARAAMRGRPAGSGSAQGRTPSTWFRVSLGGLWSTRVQGAKAAHDLVTETLTENRGNGAPPTLGSMQVQLSRSGMWWRLLDTDMGQHSLEVQKCAAPE